MIALEYFLLLLAFGGTLIGALGPKREETRTGFKALTIWGWSGLVLAFLSLVVAGIVAGRRLQELGEQSRESKKVRAIAALQIQRELWHLADLLEAVLAGETGEGQFYPCGDHFDLGLHRFKSNDYGEALEATRLSEPLPVNLGRPGTDWATYVDEVHGNALRELNRLVATYSGHIDSDTLWSVERLGEDLRGPSASQISRDLSSSTVRDVYSFVGGLENSDPAVPSWLEQLENLSTLLRADYDYSEYGTSLAWHITGRRCLNEGSV